MMKRILEDIKNQSFHQVYALVGSEAYLRKQYKEKLLSALVQPDDTMNVHYVQGKEAVIPKLIDYAETLPFFADRRVIVVEDSKLIKQGGEELSKYFEAPCESTIWILVEEEFDKRSKLYKQILKIGLCVEFVQQDMTTLKKWVASLIKKEGKNITRESLELFLESTGAEMTVISTELEKLFCYTLDKDVIDATDIEAICVPKVSSHIFDMVDGIAYKQEARVMKLYYELIELREPPIRILFLIARHMNILLQIKDLQHRGINQKEMATKVGVPPFTISKYTKQASAYTIEALKSALSQCIKADEAIKTGKMTDTLSVEVLMLSLMLEV
ncbi:MAG: DNA polymerase III subunit delta [Lachnospiraceae bacterium]